MAVPATTGQLRTKVSDMEIGDYIKANYYVTSMTTVGKIISIGRDEPNYTVEWPLTGANGLGGGIVYLVKVAKGLLICDRIPQVTLSWDVLNTSKVIQGLPWDNGTIIPTMTSNTSPSGVASASSLYSDVSFPPYMAFDGLDNDGTKAWLTKQFVLTGSLCYEFPENKRVVRYSVCAQFSQLARAPKDWTFEGSDDGATWNILDTQKGISGWVNQTYKSFQIKQSNYKFYRINVSLNNGDVNFLSIGEFKLFETVGIIRSLTGGVAYADVNGNKTLTQPNPSKGGWPTNNEFDRFLLEFPQEKIQVGKTLEDVFHIEPIQTWCQDTTVTGTLVDKSGSSGAANNTSRTVRGQMTKASWADFNWTTSNASSTNFGFRPVFSYKE